MMRSLMLLGLATILVVSVAQAGEETIQVGQDLLIRASVSDADLQSLMRTVGARSDSCVESWDPDFYYLWEWAQWRCEATECILTDADSVEAIAVVWHNYGTQPAEKEVELFIWEDAGGVPGDVLWSTMTTTTLIDPLETVLVPYGVPSLGHLGTGSIWFGHREPVPGPPSSMFDEVIDGVHCASDPPCGGWMVQDLADYLQGLNLGGIPLDVDDGGIDPNQSAIRLARIRNPVHSQLRLELILDRSRPISLELISAAGRSVASLLEQESMPGGRQELSLSLPSVSSGVYFLRFRTESRDLTRKILVVR